MYQPLNQTNQLNYKSYYHSIRRAYHKPIAQTSSALILTILTISFFGFAAIRPTLSTVSSLVGEIKEKEELEKKVDTKLNALNTAQAQFNQHQTTLLNFDLAIPPEHQLDQLLLQLEYINSLHSTRLVSLRIDPLTLVGTNPEAEASPFSSLLIRMTSKGELPQLKQLLADLNNLQRVVLIDSVSFSQPSLEDEEVDPAISMTVTFNVYYSKESIVTTPDL